MILGAFVMPYATAQDVSPVGYDCVEARLVMLEGF